MAEATVLAGKVALVTGAGRGLGEQIVRTLAAEGMRVVAADLNMDAAQRVAAEIGDARQGGSVLPLALDVGDHAATDEALAQTVRQFGGLDVVVNNAGTDLTAPIGEIGPREWQRILATNLSGPFYLARGAQPLIAARGGGHIVNIVSTAAKRAWPNAAAYHASKWGLLGLSYALHAELREQRIRVVALIAGGMRTPFLLDRFPDLDLAKLQDPADVARVLPFLLTLPENTVVPELMVLPRLESSWP
ncbi:MAG: SDR family NAD(P)-dependent oxidoreductase [Burkholderiaceae bacterium]|nr:SDR family NAD(P)-dependent oxidoreductase [Burkholderiaceae bacterium]